MSDFLLNLKNLDLSFQTTNGQTQVLKDISLSIKEGESIGVLGESGSGKTSLGRALLGLVAKNATISGTLEYQKNSYALDRSEYHRLRGKNIAMVFQQPKTSLNPVMRIDKQIAEGARLHLKLKKDDAYAKARELLNIVGLEDLDPRSYPHQLSGGMLQRVAIAIALSADPALLIADEPTTALDPEHAASLMSLFAKLKEKLNLALLFISHDLRLMSDFDRIIVLQDAEIADVGNIDKLLEQPEIPLLKRWKKILD